jgi:hypothetical protein
MQIEFADRINSIRRAGFSIRVEGKPNTENWFHFAVPTPVIVNDRRLRAGLVMVCFRSNSDNTFVHAVHIYDGEKRIAT